jgi:hypothetical protein
MNLPLKTSLLILLITALAQSAVAEEEDSDWTDRINLYGDFRLRYEAIDEKFVGSRQRSRFRARLGVSADVVDDVKVIFQLCSGGDNPVSCNQSFDDDLSSKDLSIDLAYVDWTATENLHVYGGKMKNPLYRAGKAPMVWDSDLNPEGLAVKYGSNRFFGVLGGFNIEERATSSDSMLFAAQLGTTFDFGKASKITAGIGYFGYTNTIGNKPFFFGIPLGNSVDLEGNYVYEYKDTEIFAEYDTKLGNWPLQVFAHIAKNNEVRDENTAYAVGAKIGAVKDNGSIALSWTYMDIEADSVIAAFNDSDFAGALTNSSGHLIKIGYGLTRNIALGGTFYINRLQRIIGEEHDYNRMQLDIEFKFK